MPDDVSGRKYRWVLGGQRLKRKRKEVDEVGDEVLLVRLAVVDEGRKVGQRRGEKGGRPVRVR